MPHPPPQQNPPAAPVLWYTFLFISGCYHFCDQYNHHLDHHHRTDHHADHHDDHEDHHHHHHQRGDLGIKGTFCLSHRGLGLLSIAHNRHHPHQQESQKRLLLVRDCSHLMSAVSERGERGRVRICSKMEFQSAKYMWEMRIIAANLTIYVKVKP